MHFAPGLSFLFLLLIVVFLLMAFHEQGIRSDIYDQYSTGSFDEKNEDVLNRITGEDAVNYKLAEYKNYLYLSCMFFSLGAFLICIGVIVLLVGSLNAISGGGILIGIYLVITGFSGIVDACIQLNQ